MRSAPFVLASFLLCGLAHAEGAKQQIDALYARSQGAKDALAAQRGKLQKGPSKATVVQGRLVNGWHILSEHPTVPSGAIGVGKVTEGGQSQLRLVLSKGRSGAAIGTAAQVAVTRYEKASGDPVPLYEERDARGFTYLAGTEHTRAPGSEGVAVGLGFATVVDGKQNERRLNLSLPLSPRWKTPALRDVDRRLKLVDKAQRLLGKAQMNLDFDEIHGLEGDVGKTLQKAQQLLDRAER